MHTALKKDTEIKMVDVRSYIRLILLFVYCIYFYLKRHEIYTHTIIKLFELFLCMCFKYPK